MTASPTTAAIDPRQQACAELLNAFAKRGFGFRSGRVAVDLAMTASRMAVVFPQQPEQTLRRLLTATPEVDMGDRAWLWGEPTPPAGSNSLFGSVQLIPAISVRWDWSRDPVPMRLMLALVHVKTNPGPGFRAHAYRFESPAVDAKRHSFFHAQPAITLAHKAGGHDLPGVRGPVDTSTPAFPLDVDGPVGLVLSLLLSLYGTRGLTSLFHQTPVQKTVPPFVHEMPAWAVQTGIPKP